MDHSVRVWDASSGATCSKLTHHTAAVKDAKWNLDGSQVLSCGYDKTARLVNLETGDNRNSYTFPPSQSWTLILGVVACQSVRFYEILLIQ